MPCGFFVICSAMRRYTPPRRRMLSAGFLMITDWNGRDFFVEEMDNLRITRILAKLPKPLAEEHDEIVDMTENGQKDENAAKQ